jgi:hypothetical protein
VLIQRRRFFASVFIPQGDKIIAIGFTKYDLLCYADVDDGSGKDQVSKQKQK